VRLPRSSPRPRSGAPEVDGFADADLLDANETTWAFKPTDRVGSVRKAQVTALKQLGG